MSHGLVFKCEIHADDLERIESCLSEIVDDFWNESMYSRNHEYEMLSYGNYQARWSLEDTTDEGGEEE